jgi:DUF1680 family protein
MNRLTLRAWSAASCAAARTLNRATRDPRRFPLTDVADVADAAHGVVVGPVGTTTDGSSLWPLPLSGVWLADSGWWGQWQVRNRTTTLPYGMSALESAGNLDNFRRLVGESDKPYRGFVFNDTDIYKTLEAAAWTLASWPDPVLDSYIDSVAELLSRVQATDGYLNTYVQGTPGLRRYSHLAESHELYSAGHLFQAAVADIRATGKHRLIDIAIRLADHLVAEFGERRRDDYDGHPGVETALVELFRTCGNGAYLDLAAQFVNARGRRIFGADARGHAYFQDELPIREATSIVGHAVRALYLEAGVVDVAVETADHDLLASSLVRWQDMVASKLYVTGGVGSRHKSEGFGDPYELPPDRAYCETCAAIAAIQWNWRLLLATGEARFAELLERILYNGFAASTGLDGTSFFYSNPLQVRDEHQASDEEESGQRLPWYACACCPPNVMRLVATLHHYLATTDVDGVQLHQFTDADLNLSIADADVTLSMRTHYPWAGRVEIQVVGSPSSAWTLSLRIPGWTALPAVNVNGTEPASTSDLGYLRIRRVWAPGDTVTFDLDMAPRITTANPKVDAIRGCVAIERGPLVYCIEAADNPGIDFSAVALDVREPLEDAHLDAWPDVPAIAVRGETRIQPRPLQALYVQADAHKEVIATPVNLTAIPYYLWANRADGPMRIWLPSSD